jgi:hypothetical protein
MTWKDIALFSVGYLPGLSTYKLFHNMNMRKKDFQNPIDYITFEAAIGTLSLLEEVCSSTLLLTGPVGWGAYALNKTLKNGIGESVTGRLNPMIEYSDKANSFLRESFSAMKKLSKEK